MSVGFILTLEWNSTSFHKTEWMFPWAEQKRLVVQTETLKNKKQLAGHFLVQKGRKTEQQEGNHWNLVASGYFFFVRIEAEGTSLADHWKWPVWET
jgi:hypothetical protein